MTADKDAGVNAADDVGYAKPPTTTRFKKGQSGNPSGRPKGTLNLKSDLAAELSEQIAVREGSTTKKLTKQRAMIKSQTNKGIQGDVRSAKLVLGLSEKLLDVPVDDETPLTADEQAEWEASETRRLKRLKAQPMAVASGDVGDVAIDSNTPTLTDVANGKTPSDTSSQSSNEA